MIEFFPKMLVHFCPLFVLIAQIWSLFAENPTSNPCSLLPRVTPRALSGICTYTTRPPPPSNPPQNTPFQKPPPRSPLLEKVAHPPRPRPPACPPRLPAAFRPSASCSALGNALQVVLVHLQSARSRAAAVQHIICCGAQAAE